MRFSFSPRNNYGPAPIIDQLYDHYARVTVSEESPNRPGEKLHVIIGSRSGGFSPVEFLVTECDPQTEDAFGDQFPIIADNVFVL